MENALFKIRLSVCKTKFMIYHTCFNKEKYRCVFVIHFNHYILAFTRKY